MKALYKKELMQYLNSPMGYVVPFVFAVFAGYLFLKDVFVVGSASLQPFFGIVPWLLFLYIPALAMRTLSEEKRANTMEVLLSLPITEQSVVTAKFLALATVISLTLGLTLSIPLILGLLAHLSIVEVTIGYVGILSVALLYLSITLFIASKVGNQIASFAVSAIVLFVVTALSSDFLANILPKAAQDILLYVSPLMHLDNFAKGVIDLRSVSYFVFVTLLFLDLTVMQLRKRT